MKNLFSIGFALLASALAFAQCDADHTVDVASFSYTPADLVINQGESVAFVNYGGNHDVNGIASSITGDNFNNPEEFYLPTVMGNADGVCIGTFTFNTPGTYNYDCSVGNHALNGMVATITVNPPVSNTVVDIIVNSDDHTLLEAAVVAAGLVDALNAEGPFTVFAPTDAAITALADAFGVTPEILLTLPQLGELLQYHVVAGLALSTDLSDGQTLTTLLGEDVTVTITADGVFINDAQVVLADLLADNGVVHVIDAVLLPPAPETNTVVDIIVNSDDHTVLETAVVAAGLVETLSGEGPFTVFAPTDAAFAALPAGTLDAVLADIDLLTAILTYHVVGGTTLSTDLADGQVVTTLSGADVTVTINAEGVFINDAQVVLADLLADNGVVHVIDAVLLPPAPETNTVVDIIVNSDDHTVLETAVVAAGLVETLSGEGPFTVFAPTDAAFAALPAGTLDAVLADIDLLTAILTYHVVGGTTLSTDLADGQVVTTLSGADVTVTINAEGVFINDAQVVLADLLADNGVVHVIDAVLLPPVDGIEEAVASWQVVPNPASDVVRLVSVPQNAEVTLRDMSGRVVKIVPQGAQEVHVGELPSGVYFVQWTLGARAATQKLLVQ